MTKYEICTNDFQIRCGTKKSSIPSYTEWELFDEANYHDCYAYELRASFDTEAEAREFFDKNYKDYGRTRRSRGNPQKADEPVAVKGRMESRDKGLLQLLHTEREGNL